MEVTSPLFEPKERHDRRRHRSGEGESLFTFLDRVGPSPLWDEIRGLIDAWLAMHPTADKLKARFRTGFHAEFWELYIHEVFRRLGYQGEVEPEGAPHRPDYRFVKGTASLLVECWSRATAGFDRMYGSSEKGLEVVPYDEKPAFWLGQLLDDSIASPELAVSLDFLTSTPNRPKPRRVVDQVQDWINSSPREGDEAHFSAGDWTFDLVAYARLGDEPFVALYPSVPVIPGRPGDVFLAGLLKKAKKKYQKNQDECLVIAANFPSTFFSETEVEAKLYGKGGLWSNGSNGHVSAVLVGKCIQPWFVASTLPTLWLRPGFDAFHLPVATALMTPEGLSWRDATVTTHELFGLPQGWGEDDPGLF